jgi:NAD(P)H dehydrogenase (quinone)
VLVAHPRPDSFNHAAAARAVSTLRRRGLAVVVHDLYAERFDPVLQPQEAYTSGWDAERVLGASSDPLLATHRRELGEASALVVVHPNWWGKPPAILAGWMDRVLVPGVAYHLDTAGGTPESMLSLREVLVINTTDTSLKREQGTFGDPLQAIWTQCVRPYLGDPSLERIVFRLVSEADITQRERWLDDVEVKAGTLLAHSNAE